MVIIVLGMVADMELRLIRDLQRAGIKTAKERGVYKGPRKSVDAAEVRRVAQAGTAKVRITRDPGDS